MMHKAIVRMDPTKLEMLDDFECTDTGHKFVPKNSNVRVMIVGRDWSEESILIYGSKSSDEAHQYIETIIDRITEIGHDAEIVEGPVTTNIAVNGDFKTSLELADLATDLSGRGIDVEYDPKQFPAVIVRLNSPQVTFLVFSTGKFVIQGLQELESIEPAIEQVHSFLREQIH